MAPRYLVQVALAFSWLLFSSCGSDAPPGHGVPCTPYERSCNGDHLIQCSAGGDEWVELHHCEGGCQNGVCIRVGANCPEDQDCTGLECGPDPVCGESCGSCGDDQSCDDGVCVQVGANCPEDQDCTGLECGPDPVCGEICGICDDGQSCETGTCVTDCSVCVPGIVDCDVDGNVVQCDPDGCDWSIIETCPADDSCSDGTCGTDDPAACALPWGGYLPHGDSVTAYQASSVPCGEACESETLQCDDGDLSGSYTHQSCHEEACQPCNLPWGGSIAHGASVTAYQASSVPCGETCEGETLQCDDGDLSGSYTHQSCHEVACQPCNLPWGGSIAHGETVTAYQAASVPCSETCESELIECDDGNLSGTYRQQDCTVEACRPCDLPWSQDTIEHGASVTAYQTETVPCGDVCESELIECDDGNLSGTYRHQDCAVEACRPCELPWSEDTIAHGTSVTAYQTETVPCGDVCESELIECDDGVLSGTYRQPSCEPEPPVCDPFFIVCDEEDNLAQCDADGCRFSTLEICDYCCIEETCVIPDTSFHTGAIEHVVVDVNGMMVEVTIGAWAEAVYAENELYEYLKGDNPEPVIHAVRSGDKYILMSDYEDNYDDCGGVGCAFEDSEPIAADVATFSFQQFVEFDDNGDPVLMPIEWIACEE